MLFFCCRFFLLSFGGGCIFCFLVQLEEGHREWFVVTPEGISMTFNDVEVLEQDSSK